MVPQNVRLLNRNKPEESGQMHTQEQERTQKDVENEDLLNLMENVCKIKREEPLAQRVTYFYNKIMD